MSSIFVKSILKGEPNNPLTLYDLYMEDVLIKYDVGEYLGSGKDAIKEAKLGNVKLSQDIEGGGKVKISNRQFLGFLNETVRSNREIERLVNDLTSTEKSKKQDKIYEELRRLYSKSVKDKGDLATLLDYAIFYPKQFEMSMNGAYKQTVQQLGKMASLSQTESTSNKLKTVISNLEIERKRIMQVLAKAKRLSTEAEPASKKIRAKDVLSETALADTSNLLEDFTTSIRRYRTEKGGDLNKILAQTFADDTVVKSQILDNYLEKSASEFKAIMNSFALTGKKGQGLKTTTVYDEGNPEHLKIIQNSNRLIEELEKTDRSDIIDMLRYVADTTNLVSRNIGLVEVDIDELEDLVETFNSVLEIEENQFETLAEEVVDRNSATSEEIVRLQELSNDITEQYDEVITDLRDLATKVESQTQVRDTGAGASVRVRDGEVDRTGEQDVEEGRELSAGELQYLNRINTRREEYERQRDDTLSSRDALIEQIKTTEATE